MKKEGYEYLLEEGVFYTFLSIGKKEIPKVVIFQNTEENTFNLVLGDIDFENGNISDENISNNGDMVKVLATVFQITIHFIYHHSGCKIIINGNSDIKKELYKRLIENNLKELRNFVEVKTFDNNQIVNYEIGKPNDIIFLYAKSQKNEI
jgi:hypothetical protein